MNISDPTQVYNAPPHAYMEVGRGDHLFIRTMLYKHSGRGCRFLGIGDIIRWEAVEGIFIAELRGPGIQSWLRRKLETQIDPSPEPRGLCD